MSELEPQNSSNDALSEILGFDPESGERIEDRSRLTDHNVSGLTIPLEVQEEFGKNIDLISRDLIDPKARTILKTYPEKLLSIEKIEQIDSLRVTFVRRYYSYFSTKKKNSFVWSGHAHFGISDHEYNPVIIAQHGEGDAINFATLDFIADRILFTYHVGAVDEPDDERSIYLYYDQNDKFEAILICFDKNDKKLRHIEVDSKEIKAILENPNYLVQEDQLLNVEINNNQLNVKRFNNKDIKDQLQFSLTVNRDNIIQQLFDPQTLKDPLNAPPELDNSWRFANLMDTVGVKWDRY